MATIKDVKLLVSFVVVAADLCINADCRPVVFNHSFLANHHSEILIYTSCGLSLNSLIVPEETRVERLIQTAILQAFSYLCNGRVSGYNKSVQRANN